MKLKVHPNHKQEFERNIEDFNDAVNIYEIKDLAERKMTTHAYAYYSTGSCNMQTLNENETDFERIKILPKVLVNVGEIDSSANFFGSKVDVPILFAPTALHKLAHFNGEIETAMASSEANTVLCLSSISSVSLTQIAPHAKNKWMQLYIFKDLERTKKHIELIEKNGFTTLVVTVDTPVMGIRDSENMNKFTDERVKIDPPKHSKKVESGIGNFFNQTYNSTLDWGVVKWLKSFTKMNIVLKGIHRPDDAIKAVHAGADGIIVSNHGGRQIDSAPSGIMMLKPIVEALKREGLYDKIEVFMDGGIRRGTDVFKALAFGAKAVFLGRPVLWGLQVGGKEGILKVFEMISREFRNVMAISGCKTLKDITPDFAHIDYPLRDIKF